MHPDCGIPGSKCTAPSLRPAVGEVVWRRDPVEQLSAAQTQVSMGFEPLQEAVQFSPTPFSRKLSTDSHTLVVSGLFSCRCQVVEKKVHSGVFADIIMFLVNH